MRAFSLVAGKTKYFMRVLLILCGIGIIMTGNAYGDQRFCESDNFELSLDEKNIVLPQCRSDLPIEDGDSDSRDESKTAGDNSKTVFCEPDDNEDEEDLPNLCPTSEDKDKNMLESSSVHPSVDKAHNSQNKDARENFEVVDDSLLEQDTNTIDEATAIPEKRIPKENFYTEDERWFRIMFRIKEICKQQPNSYICKRYYNSQVF